MSSEIAATHSATAPVLSVETLKVCYGDKCALADVSLTINPGEVVGILGPNGAGKTTFVKALTGKIKPTSGSIKVAGEEIKAPMVRRQYIAVAPQHAGLYDYLTVRENMEIVGAMCAGNASAQRQRIDDAIAAVDLSGKSDALASSLSGGMKQRLSFAIAASCDPRLLILDEPASGVDLGARKSLVKAMRAHADKGNSVLLVTHNLEEAEALCDRVAIFVDGRCVAYAPPAALIENKLGDKKDIVVDIDAAASLALGPRLVDMGFAESANGCWRSQKKLCAEEFVAINPLMRDIADHGGAVTIKKPGLAAVIERLKALGSAL